LSLSHESAVPSFTHEVITNRYSGIITNHGTAVLNIAHSRKHDSSKNNVNVSQTLSLYSQYDYLDVVHNVNSSNRGGMQTNPGKIYDNNVVAPYYVDDKSRFRSYLASEQEAMLLERNAYMHNLHYNLLLTYPLDYNKKIELCDPDLDALLKVSFDSILGTGTRSNFLHKPGKLVHNSVVAYFTIFIEKRLAFCNLNFQVGISRPITKSSALKTDVNWCGFFIGLDLI
jgi:hypothetical protein